jgi:hypothetical protein
LHVVFTDGVWARSKGSLQFFPFRQLATDDVMDVLFGIERRLETLFRRKGFIRGHKT